MKRYALWENAALFAIGGGTYVGLELLWRRRSHISMFGAGGLCFLLLGALEKKKLPLPVRAAAGAGVITAVELGTGLLVNRDHRVWDYRGLPGNFRGQICPCTRPCGYRRRWRVWDCTPGRSGNWRPWVNDPLAPAGEMV